LFSLLPIRAPLSPACTGVPGGDDGAVGLDAGRGTTRETSVASALHPVKIRGSGATASITEAATG